MRVSHPRAPRIQCLGKTDCATAAMASREVAQPHRLASPSSCPRRGGPAIALGWRRRLRVASQPGERREVGLAGSQLLRRVVWC